MGKGPLSEANSMGVPLVCPQASSGTQGRVIVLNVRDPVPSSLQGMEKQDR